MILIVLEKKLLCNNKCNRYVYWGALLGSESVYEINKIVDKLFDKEKAEQFMLTKEKG